MLLLPPAMKLALTSTLLQVPNRYTYWSANHPTNDSLTLKTVLVDMRTERLLW